MWESVVDKKEETKQPFAPFAPLEDVAMDLAMDFEEETKVD